MNLKFRIDEAGLQELADLIPAKFVEAKEIEVREGKIRSEDFSAPPSRLIFGWTVWAKPFLASPFVLGLEFGVAKLALRGKLLNYITDRLPRIPRLQMEQGRLLLDLAPLRIERVSAERGILEIEVKHGMV